jgi:hypothetical protein
VSAAGNPMAPARVLFIQLDTRPGSRCSVFTFLWPVNGLSINDVSRQKLYRSPNCTCSIGMAV